MALLKSHQPQAHFVTSFSVKVTGDQSSRLAGRCHSGHSCSCPGPLFRHTAHHLSLLRDFVCARVPHGLYYHKFFFHRGPERRLKHLNIPQTRQRQSPEDAEPPRRLSIFRTGKIHATAPPCHPFLPNLLHKLWFQKIWTSFLSGKTHFYIIIQWNQSHLTESYTFRLPPFVSKTCHTRTRKRINEMKTCSVTDLIPYPPLLKVCMIAKLVSVGIILTQGRQTGLRENREGKPVIERRTVWINVILRKRSIKPSWKNKSTPYLRFRNEFIANPRPHSIDALQTSNTSAWTFGNGDWPSYFAALVHDFHGGPN